MQLYSKKQLIKGIIISSSATLIIAAAVCIPLVISAKGNKKANTSSNFSDLSNVTSPSSLDTGSALLNDDSYYTQDELRNIQVYENCNEAVVNITTQVMGYDWFLEPVVTQSGSGSGSIIDKNGYVVTNYHVIDGATSISISLADGSSYEGKVIGKDEKTDIAVLKFDPPSGVSLKTIAFGDSDNLKVGQKVIAIGNPFALERTMTTGCVSGLGRPIQENSDVIIRNMIQTDAAINPGNSGGPLLDSHGKMIGINTIIYSNSGSSSGIGFAIPASTARRVVTDLINNGKVTRGVIKISLVQNSAKIASYAGYKINTGIIVSKVGSGSQAELSGLKGGSSPVSYGTFNPKTIYLGGDIITAINDISVSNLAEYYSVLEDHKPGDSITVKIYRKNKYITLSLVLEDE